VADLVQSAALPNRRITDAALEVNTSLIESCISRGKPRSRFDASRLNAWRVRHGLRVQEMAWLFGYSVSTLKDKLYGCTPIRPDTERIVDLVDLALHRGYPPPGWPARLRGAVHVNTLPSLTADALDQWPASGEARRR